MALTALQHINIRCTNAARSREFYVGLLGLRPGPRPPFASSGYWLYLDDVPVVHLVQRPEGEAAQNPQTGNLDHIAFGASGLETTRQTLSGAGIPFSEAVVPRDNTVQLFVRDPDGVPLELNFPQ